MPNAKIGLLQARAELLVQARRDYLEPAVRERRAQTAEELGKYETCMRGVADIDAQLAMEGGRTPAWVHDAGGLPPAGPGPTSYHGASPAAAAVSGVGSGRTYLAMFPDADPRDAGGFKSIEDFLGAVYKQDFSRLQAAGFGEGAGSSGGFSVPPQFGSWLMDGALEGEIVRPRATVFPMLSDQRLVPAWENSDHTLGLFGGIVPVWTGENATGVDQVGKLRQLTLKASKLLLYSAASSELLSDGLSFEAQLGEMLRTAIGFELDRKFLGGSGAGVPLGILNAPCTITVAEEGSQTGSSIVIQNLTKMIARLLPASYRKAVWVCSPSCIPQLMQLTIAVGTAGGAFIPAITQVGDTLSAFGRPLIVSEKVPAVGTRGDIGLYDFSAYLVGLRREIALDRSNAPGWHEDQISFRCSLRVDGQPALASPVTPAGGGDTLSPFVVLADRT